MGRFDQSVMLLVPDITAGTGTEFEEMLVRGGSGGLSQSEGAQERVLSVDGSLSECRRSNPKTLLKIWRTPLRVARLVAVISEGKRGTSGDLEAYVRLPGSKTWRRICASVSISKGF
jgi:hypothetical protein